MKTQEKKPEAVSHTLQAKSGKTHQPPATTVLQAYKEGVIQREADEEEEPLQMKSQQSPANAAVLQAYKEGVVQREIEEEEEPLQMKNNQTGLPDNLKSGVEALSGYSMDDVRVHYNSSQPAQFQALAYTQGTNIHVAPGQEQHLAHEAWHVVQQKQGRVQPTMQMKGVNVNDDEGLEREADEMGMEAMSGGFSGSLQRKAVGNQAGCMQRRPIHIGKNNQNVENFKRAYFASVLYNNPIGRFYAQYFPSRKTLEINLPVHFPTVFGATEEHNGHPLRAISDEQKQFFKSTVHDTWSNQHPLKTNATRYHRGINPWKDLNPVKVDVSVDEVTDTSQSFFSISGNDSYDQSAVYGHGNAKSSAANVSLGLGGYYESLVSDATHNKKSTPSAAIPSVYHALIKDRDLNVFAHEAGHMLGLDDEYQVLNYQVPATGIKVYNNGIATIYNQNNVSFTANGKTYRIERLLYKILGTPRSIGEADMPADQYLIPYQSSNKYTFYLYNDSFYFTNKQRNTHHVLENIQWKRQNEVVEANGVPRHHGMFNIENTVFERGGYLFYIDGTNRVLRKLTNNVWNDSKAIKGTVSGHFDLTERILGEDYAKEHALMDKTKVKTTLMGGGATVKRHHYVTFVDALVQGIQVEYEKTENPNAPNQVEDWTIG